MSTREETSSAVSAGAASYDIGKHLLAWGFAGAVVILLVWFAWDFLLLSFAGCLLAILLVACTDWLEQRTALSRNWSLGIVIVFFVIVAGLLAWLWADRAAQESGEMAELLPKSLDRIRDWLARSQWGIAAIEFTRRASQTLHLEQRTAGVLAGLVSAAAGVVVVLAVGFFLAVDSQLYQQGFLRLFPVEYRGRVGVALHEAAHTLRWWLLGQLVSMTALGVASYIGLVLLHVPLPVALALLTAVLIFIPYIGALASEIPAVLVALTGGPVKAAEVFLMYLVLHVVEAYILTPLVQRRAVRLPPVITILSQALMWTTAGVAGMALAAPLAAATLSLVRTLYLRDAPENAGS